MSNQLDVTGDPWIDAYLMFRQAWLDGATETELTDLADECQRDLPSPTPPAPAALFIHGVIVITAGQQALSPWLVTALWVPQGSVHRPVSGRPVARHRRHPPFRCAARA